jgi:hypothetical protein
VGNWQLFWLGSLQRLALTRHGRCPGIQSTTGVSTRPPLLFSEESVEAFKEGTGMAAVGIAAAVLLLALFGKQIGGMFSAGKRREPGGRWVQDRSLGGRLVSALAPVRRQCFPAGERSTGSYHVPRAGLGAPDGQSHKGSERGSRSISLPVLHAGIARTGSLKLVVTGCACLVAGAGICPRLVARAVGQAAVPMERHRPGGGGRPRRDHAAGLRAWWHKVARRRRQQQRRRRRRAVVVDAPRDAAVRVRGGEGAGGAGAPCPGLPFLCALSIGISDAGCHARSKPRHSR